MDVVPTGHDGHGKNAAADREIQRQTAFDLPGSSWRLVLLPLEWLFIKCFMQLSQVSQLHGFVLENVQCETLASHHRASLNESDFLA